MKLHKKLLTTSGIILVASAAVFAVNFNYMYKLLDSCIELNKCEPYPLWDIVNLASIIGAGVGLLLLCTGLALMFRHIDREDNQAPKSTP